MPTPITTRLIACASLQLSVFSLSAASDEPIHLEKFVVTPGHYLATSDPATAPLTRSAETLQALPQVADDLYRTIAHFPGLTTNDFSARFWVRGAPHEQILTRLDGLDLIEPFHLRDFDGSLSIIDPRAIDRFTLHTGGFTAEYGNRIGAVIEFETDAIAAPTQPRTGLNASVTGLRAAHERPFAKNKGHVFISARLGTPGPSLRLLDYEEIDATYHDVLARVSYQLNDAHRLSLNLLHAYDDISFVDPGEPRLSSSYQSDNLWARLQSRFTPDLHAETVLSYQTFDTERRGEGPLSAFSALRLRDERDFNRLQLRQDWRYHASDRALIRAGFALSRSDASFAYDRVRQRVVIPRNGSPVIENEIVSHRLSPDADDTGLYATARLRVLPNLIAEPGVRYDDTSLNKSSAASPRISIAGTFGDNTVRAGWGIYRQHQELHQLDVPDGDFSYRPTERTHQLSLGFDRLIGPLRFRAELYQRLSSNPPARYENVSIGYDTFLEARSDRLFLTPTEARSHGAEFVLSKRTATIDASASYTLSETEEKLPSQGWTPRARDQRHAIGLTFVYTPNTRWRLSAAWRYHSGWATTAPRYELVSLPDGSNAIGARFDPLYASRLPDYHRLDLRLDRRWRWADGKTLSVYLDLFNAYSRKNLIGYTRTVTLENNTIVEHVEADKQFPLLPNFGATFEF